MVRRSRSVSFAALSRGERLYGIGNTQLHRCGVPPSAPDHPGPLLVAVGRALARLGLPRAALDVPRRSIRAILRAMNDELAGFFTPSPHRSSR